MPKASDVLILDDGELDDLAGLLDDLGVAYTRRRGGEHEADRPAPRCLLVSTPRRAEPVPSEGGEGPTRIIAAEEDSNALRRMLRRQGYDMLVRRPTHREVWRLLVQRALYQGDERRRETRIAVGSPVALSASQSDRQVLLVDVSNRGCRVVSNQDMPAGSRLSVEIPSEVAGSQPLRLEGRVLRVNAATSSEGGVSYTAAVLFDAVMPAVTRARLAELMNCWTRGPESLSEPKLGSLPACDAVELDGLTLDDETDPAVAANIAVDIHMERDASAERRRNTRGAFEQPIEAVEASGERKTWVLMGRDLSSRGMRVESLPGLDMGDSFDLAIYCPTHEEPFRMRARIVRDDGEAGMALTFDDLDDGTAKELEKMVACLPDWSRSTRTRRRASGR